MSNSAAPTPPSGPNSTTPNTGGPAPVRRRRPAPSAFVEKKRPVAKRPVTAQRPGSAVPATQGAPGQQQPIQAANAATTTTAPPAAPEPKFTEYGVYISKKDIEDGMRYHGFKFSTRVDANEKPPVIDPYDASQFTRPVRLHRRYARDKQDLGEPVEPPPGIDDKERELYNARRAERQAEREANQALIAPTGTVPKKAQGKKKNQKSVEDVYYNENNPKQQKAAQLRYEETKPWHLEDFENKNTWIGTYQEPMSNSSVLLTVDPNHAIFTMTPIERWYKFTQTNRLAAMSAEEAEKYMQAKVQPTRWFQGTQVFKDEKAVEDARLKREKMSAMKRAQAAEDNGYAGIKDEGEFYNADRDDLDFEFNDEFQDDDEGQIFGIEADEAKDIEKRIREEMRGANISAPGLKNTEMDFDEEEERQKREEREQKKREKRMKKQLIKKERKYEYEDDSEENPYSESSEDEDSDEERERLEAEQKEEEERKAAQANGDKSGASTKGTNTPSGRSEKKDPSRSNAALAANLKRPGSPNLSDASGTESRKKAKTNGRAMSPNAPNGSLSPDAAKSRHTGYGSGSETDTSRAARPSQKLRLKSQPGSPRDGTPSGTPSGSRAGSPDPLPLPTLEEVKAAIPEEGIAISELVQMFKKRVAGKEKTSFFISLVRSAGKQNQVTKKIHPKRE